MYKHIGKKIKFFAIFCFILGLLATLCAGVVMILVGVMFNGSAVVTLGEYQVTMPGGITMIISGALTIIVGFLLSWISSWYTYGMGQMIDNTDSMVEMQNEMINRLGGILQQQQQEIACLQQSASDIAAAVAASAPAAAPAEEEEAESDDDLVVSTIEE